MAVALTATALACTSTDAEQSSPIRLNQLGELPDGVKIAITPDDSKQPLEWSLVGADGKGRRARQDRAVRTRSLFRRERPSHRLQCIRQERVLDFDCGPETR